MYHLNYFYMYSSVILKNICVVMHPLPPTTSRTDIVSIWNRAPIKHELHVPPPPCTWHHILPAVSMSFTTLQTSYSTGLILYVDSYSIFLFVTGLACHLTILDLILLHRPLFYRLLERCLNQNPRALQVYANRIGCQARLLMQGHLSESPSHTAPTGSCCRVKAEPVILWYSRQLFSYTIIICFKTHTELIQFSK